MATLRRRSDSAALDVRSALTDQVRAAVEDATRRHRLFVDNGDGTCFVNPLPRLLERLEAGQPVEVAGWRLAAVYRSARAPRPRWLNAQTRYRVDGDGDVTAVC